MATIENGAIIRSILSGLARQGALVTYIHLEDQD